MGWIPLWIRCRRTSYRYLLLPQKSPRSWQVKCNNWHPESLLLRCFFLRFSYYNKNNITNLRLNSRQKTAINGRFQFFVKKKKKKKKKRWFLNFLKKKKKKKKKK